MLWCVCVCWASATLIRNQRHSIIFSSSRRLLLLFVSVFFSFVLKQRQDETSGLTHNQHIRYELRASNSQFVLCFNSFVIHRQRSMNDSVFGIIGLWRIEWLYNYFPLQNIHTFQFSAEDNSNSTYFKFFGDNKAWMKRRQHVFPIVLLRHILFSFVLFCFPRSRYLRSCWIFFVENIWIFSMRSL